MIGQNFADLKLQRNRRVRSLSAMRSTIKLRNETLVIDEQQMVNSILLFFLRQYVQYEFVNFAPSLFDAVSMRKTAKAALNRILDVDSNLVASPTPGYVPTVIDGGHLLHAVVWNAPCFYADVVQGYVLYINKHFPNRFVVVVFDGYSSQKLSTQVVEQSRRSSKVTSADISVSPSKNTSTTQRKILGNGHNKTSLILVLMLSARM